MAIRIVSVHAETCGMGIYAIMLPSSGFSVAHWVNAMVLSMNDKMSPKATFFKLEVSS